MKFLEESARGRSPARLGQLCLGSREVFWKVQELSELELEEGRGDDYE